MTSWQIQRSWIQSFIHNSWHFLSGLGTSEKKSREKFIQQKEEKNEYGTDINIQLTCIYYLRDQKISIVSTVLAYDSTCTKFGMSLWNYFVKSVPCKQGYAIVLPKTEPDTSIASSL